MSSFFFRYRAHRFSVETQDTIERANSIIEEMDQLGYTLTLRQLYYQFVRRNWIANQDREYKRLGAIVTKAREAGEIDWLAIEDRGRHCYRTITEDDAGTVLSGVEHGIALDYWRDQRRYVEVWVEKEALSNVVSRPCRKFDVPYMACKGYLSASEAWRAGQRFEEAIANGNRAVLIHLADHDPSGLDMTRDNTDRLELFAGSPIEVRRIALNMDQIQAHDPPPNPAKITDSRSTDYIARFGYDSWELDALEPQMLDQLITRIIKEYIDPDIWAATSQREKELRAPLAALSDNWDEVEQFIRDQGMVA